MNICAIVVGFNHWWAETPADKDFTHRFIKDLTTDNPSIRVILIDNFSQRPYPDTYCEVIRLEKRVGYAAALNEGMRQADKADWIITLNNDIEMTGNGDAVKVIESLNENVLYGSGWNCDGKLKINFQWSAWLCISRKIFNAVGYFDEKLAAAFEDFDYQLRAIAKGFTLDTAKLPMEHLDRHTRFEDKKCYPARWDASREWFCEKHGLEIKPWFTDREIQRGLS